MEKGKLRGKPKERIRKSVVAFNAEGINKTESIYLGNYNSRDLSIKMARGNSTDPIGMYNELIKYCKEEDIKNEYGDKIYLFLDTDCREDKIDEIKRLIKKKDNDIQIIYSVPTFEVWYLNHFVFSTKEYLNNKSIIDELKKHLGDYSKSKNYFEKLNDKINDAIKNSILQEEYHKNNSIKKELYECNPYTNVYKAIEEIMMIKNKNESE